MNIFSTGPNLSGDVCSILFGSTSILTETPVGSTIVAIDMIAFATASIFGKVIAMWSYEKIYKTHGGNLTDDIYIYMMWKSYDIEENIKKGNRLWSGKDG